MRKEFNAPFDADLPGGAGKLSPDNPYGTARITETAQRLHILSLLASERTVQEYLGTHNELSDLEQAMTQARGALIAKEDVSISFGINRTLQANYTQALGFTHAALIVVEDGLHLRSVDQTVHELETTLTPLLTPMGMYLTEFTPGSHRQKNGLLMSKYEATSRAERTRKVKEDDNLREELVRRTETGFFPTVKWQGSQAIRSYTEILTYIANAENHILHIRAGRRNEELEEDGVTTLIGKDRSRFGLIENLMYAIQAGLEEGIVAQRNGEKHTPSYQYASYLSWPLSLAYEREVVW